MERGGGGRGKFAIKNSPLTFWMGWRKMAVPANKGKGGKIDEKAHEKP